MFEYENDVWTLEDLQKAAKNQGLDFETYLEEMKKLGMVEKQTIDESTVNLNLQSNIEHISEDEFMSISSGGFGVPGFVEGREEKMTQRLYEIYNPERDPNKVQFKQFGTGNNVRVVLPNGEEEDFELSGVGGMFGGEVGDVKNDYVRLTQFIQSDQKKLKVSDEKTSQIEDIILNRKRKGSGVTQKERLEGDAAGIVNDELDDNVARELNLLGLKNKKGSYTFEADKWYRNAIKITTPGGAEKTINIGNLVGDDREKKQKILNSVMRFIESDPSTYEMTDEYNASLEELKKVTEPYLQQFIDNPERAISLLSETNKTKLGKELKRKLKTDYQSWFGSENMTFQNITRDQQNDLVNQMIQTTIDNAMDKISLDLSTAERKDLEKEGYDLDAVYAHVDKRTRERFSGLNRQIFDLNIELDNPDLSETERATKLKEVNGLKYLKAQETGEEYSFFIDMNTLTRSLSSGEEENVIDLTKKVERKSNEVQAENLTRAQLKGRYINANLAYDEWEDTRNTKKHMFVVPTKKAQNFLKTAKQSDGSAMKAMTGGDKQVFLDSQGRSIKKGETYTYVMLTDKEAARHSYWLELDNNAGYQSRLQHGVNLRVNREVYDKQYGLNEGIQSQNVQTWYESTATNFLRGFHGKEYELKHGIPDDQFRQAFLDVQTEELGIEATAEEKEEAKSTFGETTGAALSGLPKMVTDFYVGNKVLAATGLIRAVGSLVNNLKKTRYAIKIGGKTKHLSETQLLKHIGTTGKHWKKSVKNIKPGTGQKEAIITNWLKTMKYGDDVFVPASTVNQGAAVALNGLLEGVKMEVAMQSPTSQIFGFGDPDDLPALGSSYATGFGFGAASSLIPWNRMFKAVAGKKAGKGVSIPFTASKYPGLGGKIVPKEVSYKGMYDYLVAAPWSFYAGAQFGNFTNQIADNMMGNKAWSDWLDENYGDWDHVLKHAATELITGLALKIGHGKKYDFASENRLWRVQRQARKDLREKVYEDVVQGRDGQLYKKTVKSGVEMLEQITPDQIFRKGKSQVDANRLQSIESLATQRLHEIRDTKAYLDPIQGPIKFMEKWKPHLKELGETKDFRFKFDYNIDKMNIKFIKGKDGKQITQATFNPRNVSIDYLPHELLHFMTWKKMGKKGEYTGEDVMFKNKAVDGMVELSKEMEFGDGRTLYEAMKEAGVLKEGRYKGEIQQTKEWELFSYIAEFYGKEGNQEMIEAKYGYDKLASFTDKLIKDNFNGAHTPLNTQKDLVLFFGNYARNIGKGEGITGSLKHLEKFVSPAKTKRQQKAREKWESENGVGETKQLRTQNLNKKIAKKLEEMKSNPAFVQFQKDKDADKYKKDPKTIKLLAELAKMRENLKNIPEDVVWGKETPIEKTINDLARVGDRMMTNAEWNAKGKKEALKELARDGGAFDGIITTGIDFSKGIEGRSRETWIQDVKLGIPKVDKGLYGTLERFKPETDLQGKESLSAWVNKQYQWRRGKIYNYYEANPIGESLQKKAGEGQTIGDRLLAPTDPSLKKFEDVNILQEAIKEGKEAEFQDVVTIEGERKVKSEIPVSKEAFKPWEKTILDNMPGKEKAKEMGYRDITDLAPKFTEGMYNVKLTDAQRKNLNDIGGETNLENFQKSVKADYNVPIMQKRTVDGKVETKAKIYVDGTPATKKIKNSQRIADGLPSGTVKFDKGVSDALVGRSAFPRLGTLGELYHLATPKNYTRAELRELGFETNPKPHSAGYWRAATGPGGRIYIKGKAKGQKLTGKDVEQFVGIKDGKLTKLSADRSLGGKSRRIISEDGRHITEQVMTESGNLDMNIVANFKGGKSRSFWTKTLSKVVDQKSREKFLEEIRSDAFHEEFYRQIEIEFNKGKKGSQEKAVENAIVKHFDLVNVREGGKFKITPKELKKIAKEIYREFVFARPEVVKQGLISRAKVAIERPSTNEGVEAKWIAKGEKLEIIDGPGKLFDKETIRDGIVYEMKAVERLTEKYGVGVYEAHLLAGASGGGGIGKYSTLANMLNNLPGTLRYTIFRSANAKYAEGKGKAAEEGDITYDAYAMLDAVYKKMAAEKGVRVEDLKKYTDAKRANQTKVGVKAEVMKELDMLKEGAKEFNEINAKKLYEYGEKNKTLLLDSIEGLLEVYKSGEASQRVVRQWVEMHAGSMDGLIKTSASLAVLPNVKMSDLIKKHGNNPKDWVLEHITPAQYVKARIYDYILSKGDKTLKAEMELAIRDHHTTLIPKKYDTMVNKILQSDLPASHRPGMDPLQSRYYEASHSADFDLGLRVFTGRNKGKTYDHHPNLSFTEKAQKRKEVGDGIKKAFPKSYRKVIAKNYNSKNLDIAKKIDAALNKGRKKDQKARGMSTFDFDETVGMSENFVIARKGKETKRIASDKWPFVGEKMVKEGWKMDFSDFNKVTKGKPGPLMEKMKNQIKKYGPENVFILTARAPESAKAIHEYLKSEGIKIPLENITGLGNSTGEAKALWMLQKFAEGYNDMYFVDDALPNVKAVKDVLDQLDIKSNVQIARQFNTRNLSKNVNDIMEHSLDIGSKKVFSKAEAKTRGKDIKRRRVFMRDSAADLELLIEPLYGKGKEGIKNKKWFKEEFIIPFERGIRDYNTARQSAKNDYMNLRKQNKDVIKEISKEVEGTSFTNDMAMRVYLWNKAGYKIPDLARATELKLIEHVRNNPKLQAYAETFAKITKQEKGLKEPGENWWAETMAGEVTNINRGVSRKQYLQEWIDIKNEIFNEANLNKMESKLGTEWRENIEDMFDRMETGRTRSLKMDRGSAMMMNYLNGSIGSIMNFNTRSAALQTISTLNFLNMRENNPIAAARAMANIPQFSKDFMRIMNSDMLKQRRDGLSINVTEAEIASAAAGSKNPIQSIIAKVLKHGYLPTKLADSFAISFGGATFYRNRIKMYEKQGMKTKEAEKQAWLDFQVLSERTQQSSRADLLSKQQTSLIGRFILPFANTPMQMNRAGMKDILDISKGRYKNTAELGEKMGRITYYMGAQIAMFAGLQSAMFALMLNDEDVPKETVERSKTYMLGSTTDSFLRGFGVQGAVLSAFKNAVIQYAKQSKKPQFTADYSEVAEALLNISPPIGSKFGKLDRAGEMTKWAKIRKEDEFKFELGNPSLEALLLTIEAITNAPLHGWHQNAFNIQHALSDDYEMWQRAHMFGGWTPFQVGIETEKKKSEKKSKKKSKKKKSSFIYIPD